MFQKHPRVMSLNQIIIITTVYQTHNNNNYPTININKLNKIDTVFDCSPSRVVSQKKLLPLFNRNGQRVIAHDVW